MKEKKPNSYPKCDRCGIADSAVFAATDDKKAQHFTAYGCFHALKSERDARRRLKNGRADELREHLAGADAAVTEIGEFLEANHRERLVNTIPRIVGHLGVIGYHLRAAKRVIVLAQPPRDA